MFNFVTNNKKFVFISTFFKKRIKRWFKFILKVYLKEDTNSKKICTKFEIFKKEIQKIFDVLNKKQTAEKIVQYLQQKISTFDYATRFQEKANLIK